MGPHHPYLCSSHRIHIPAGGWSGFRVILSQELLNVGWCPGCSCYQKIWGKQIISEWTPAQCWWQTHILEMKYQSSKKFSLYFRLLCHGLPGFQMFFSLTLSHSSSGENIRIPKLLSDKDPTCWCRRHRFDPWVGKILWSRKWLPTQVFLLGKFHGLRSLASYSPWVHKESDMMEHTHTHIQGKVMSSALLKIPTSGCKIFQYLSSDYFLNLSYWRPFLHAFRSNLRKNLSGWLNVFQQSTPFCTPSLNILGLQVISMFINTGTNIIVWF